MHNLTAAEVKTAKPGDKLSDGGGLRLDVDKNGNAAWIFRFTSPATGRERFMGLGPAHDVPLAKARDAAQKARELLRQHVDPIEQRKAQREAAKVEANRSVTFQAYAARYIATHEPGWKNVKHKQQWPNSLAAYAYPHIGHMPAADVSTEDVRRLLNPIWLTKRETAARVRGRIEKIMDAAKAEGLRTGDNPALWGILKHLLPKQDRKRRVKHHPALPFKEMPAFYASLAADTSRAAHLLRWIILTACRFNEAPPRDGEIKDDVWTIPSVRMKTGKEHTVPLSAAAAALLPVPRASDTALTKCIRRHTATPASTHGFRSTFRDWAGDASDAAREVAEHALAHAVGNETEASYRRGTALEKRRLLMEAWADYCNSAVNS